MSIVTRAPLLEVDFLNDLAVHFDAKYVHPDTNVMEVPNYPLKSEMKEQFLSDVVGTYWHTDQDKLDTVIFYNDGSVYCQRRKLKYDFDTSSQYWDTYHFNTPTNVEIVDLYNNIIVYLQGLEVCRKFEVIGKTQSIDEELMFFDQTYSNRLIERNKILAMTDWRVLDDVDDSYVGEKDEWKKYRQALRDTAIAKPSDYDTPLDFFKEMTTMKWPVDPKNYRKEYPNGQDANGDAVEYLKADDDKQWVPDWEDSSVDMLHSKLVNINELRQKYRDANVIVKKEVRDMMKLLKMEDFVTNGIDYTKVYTQEEIDAMGGS